LNTFAQTLISKKMVGSFTMISIAYVASYTLVVGFFYPLQSLIFPTFTSTISLLFLPHGIRILAAYYYGWKAFFLLLPSMYIMWIISVYGVGVPLHPIQPVISGVSCVLGIMIVSTKITHNLRKDLKPLLMAGIFGSVLNGLFNSFLVNQKFFISDAFYFIIGDVLGLIVLMLLFSQTVRFITSLK